MPILTSKTYNGTAGQPIYGGLQAPPPNELRISLPTGTQTNYPFQFGRAFAPGAIVGEPAVALDGVQLAQQQADIKTRYEDGTVKFAVISVIIPSLSTTERVLSISNKAAAVRQPETVANMLANYDFNATIGVDVAGTPVAGSPVSARTMLAALTDAGLAAETAANGVNSRYWTVGPVCTTVLLCDHSTKARDIGTNATRAIRPMFHVQFWPSIGRYRVRHIMEVCDTTKYKDELGIGVTFTTGQAAPAVRLSQPTLNMFAGSVQSRRYWGGVAIPTCNAVHGVAYLSHCGVFENYDASITMNPIGVNDYKAVFDASNKALGEGGRWTKAMPTTGGRQDISTVPKWDVVALFSGAAHMHEIAEFQSEAFGNWTVHSREGLAGRTFVSGVDALGRVLSKNARPTLTWLGTFNTSVYHLEADRFTIDGTLSTTKDGWINDAEHTPGGYWFSYLTTGEYQWLEKLQNIGAHTQFWTLADLGFNESGVGLNLTDTVMHTLNLRAWSWNFRNRARAAWASPNGTPEKTMLDKAVLDEAAHTAGVYDVPEMFVGNPLRDAWNAAYTNRSSTRVPAFRPNALHFADRNAQFRADQVLQPPPTNMVNGHSTFQHAHAVSVSYHVADLGFGYVKPLAHWLAHYFIQKALSSEPRHLGDFANPATTATGWYQSFETIYAEWGHNADGVEPDDMPPNPATGFPGSGGGSGVTVSEQGSLAAAAIAVSNGAPSQAAAWAVVEPWVSNTNFLDYDPRYSILPRA